MCKVELFITPCRSVILNKRVVRTIICNISEASIFFSLTKMQVKLLKPSALFQFANLAILVKDKATHCMI